MLYAFFLTLPGMALIVIVCIGNVIAFRARRAYSNAIGFTILGVLLVPAAFLSIMWSGASPMPAEERGDPFKRAMVATVVVFMLIWVPVLIRWVVDRRRRYRLIEHVDHPTGGFPVVPIEKKHRNPSV